MSGVVRAVFWSFRVERRENYVDLKTKLNHTIKMRSKRSRSIHEIDNDGTKGIGKHEKEGHLVDGQVSGSHDGVDLIPRSVEGFLADRFPFVFAVEYAFQRVLAAGHGTATLWRRRRGGGRRKRQRVRTRIVAGTLRSTTTSQDDQAGDKKATHSDTKMIHNNGQQQRYGSITLSRFVVVVLSPCPTRSSFIQELWRKKNTLPRLEGDLKGTGVGHEEVGVACRGGTLSVRFFLAMTSGCFARNGNFRKKGSISGRFNELIMKYTDSWPCFENTEMR